MSITRSWSHAASPWSRTGQPLGDGVVYDDCYVEDVDNQIDIILQGDDAAARSITHVEVPSSGDYLPLYNPGQALSRFQGALQRAEPI